MAPLHAATVLAALLQSAVAPLPRGKHPHEVATGPRDAWEDSLGVVHDEDGEADYPYSGLISESVEYCYRKLVQDASCCIDQNFSPGVRRHVISRPGTEWKCGGDCYDAHKGRRGRDTMWVPHGATCDAPRILWVHGGSWWYGSPDTLGYGQLGSKLAALTGAVVMIADYPLIPAGNYSVILHQVGEALRWLVEKGGPEGCTSSNKAPLFVGGDSAGGGTALSLVLTLKRKPELLPGRALAGALLWSPWTNLMCNTPEYYHHAFAKIVHPRKATKRTVYVGDIIFQGRPEQNLDWFTANAEGYVGSDYSLLRDPIASPFHAREEDLGGGGVPPLYFAVGGSESILGDSVVVAQKASSSGVDVQLDVYTGMWHVFPMYSEGCGSGVELWQARRAWEQTAAFVRWAAAARRPASPPLPGFSSLVAAADAGAGASAAKPPFTVLNYELEKAPAPSDLAARSPAGAASHPEVGSALVLPPAVSEVRRCLEDRAHAITFLAGVASALATQSAARRLRAAGRKELPGSLAAPLIA